VGDEIGLPPFGLEAPDTDKAVTRRIQRVDLADLQARQHAAEPPTPSAPAPPARSPDWADPPGLPAPPVQFTPPDIALPLRPSDPSVPSVLDPPSGESSSTGARFAAAFGTPELPDLTPSPGARPDEPGGGRRRRPTEELASGGAGRRRERPREFESTVISRVVDMSPVMNLNPGAEVSGVMDSPSWGQGDSLVSDLTSAEPENVTAVWAAEPEPAPAPPAAAAPAPAPAPAPERRSPEPAAPAPAPERRPPEFAPASGTPDKRDLIAGRYRVIERVGMGGMARIYKVQHLELGKDFALKIIHSALSEDPKVQEMFYREARLASSMDHPNIVLVTDFGVDKEYGAFIVMEYLKGETLHARLRREARLNPSVMLEVALQVAEALHLIHSKNVVHCDIKSENVFLCVPPAEQRRRTIVKLLDFGLSRQKIASVRVSMSEVGGTPAYMAPERINRMSPRPSMDIYSLGILMYEMLTGSLPFMGTMEEVLLAQLHQEPEPPSKRIKEAIDDSVQELVLKAMRKNPDERQRDMGAVIYEIRTVMDMLGVGRRRAKGPAAQLRTTTGSARAKNCELLVADCPLPLFMIDPAGQVLLANKAFASFVNLTVEQIAGVALADTRLGRICPEITEDIQKVTTTSKQTQRILSFPWRSAKQVSMMIWLSPEIIDKQLVAIVGVVHPFTSSTAG
jgi:hypothetical protein